MAPDSSTSSHAVPRYWRALALLVCGALVGATFLAVKFYRESKKERAKARTAQTERGKEEPAEAFDARESRYLDGVADRFGFPRRSPWGAGEALRLMVRQNQELNGLTPAVFDAARAPWLRPVPVTLGGRVLTGGKSGEFALTGETVSCQREHRFTNTR